MSNPVQHHCCIMVASLFADVVVMMAPSVQNLQLPLDRFAVKCMAAGIRIGISKSEAMVLSRKLVDCAVPEGKVLLIYGIAEEMVKAIAVMY